MAALIFDTLSFSKQLKTAGVPAAQAEAETKVLAELFEADLKDLATKDDLFITQKSLQHEMKDLRHEIGDMRHEMKSMYKDLDAKIEKVDIKLSGEMSLIKWMFGAMIAGIIGILTKLFF